MKTTVFAVEVGEYSDYRVLGVYSTRENAQTMINAVFRPKDDGTYEVGYGDKPTIVEWTMDPGVDELQRGYKRFDIQMQRDGSVWSIGESDDSDGVMSWFRINWMKHLEANVWAADKEHAVKIVNERRAQMIANGEWSEKA